MFLSRDYRLIEKFDVLKTNILAREANLREFISNFHADTSLVHKDRVLTDVKLRQKSNINRKTRKKRNKKVERRLKNIDVHAYSIVQGAKRSPCIYID